MELTNLERNLITLAQRELDGMSVEVQEGRNEVALQRYHAIQTLLGLLDMDNCGLSAPAAQMLLGISCKADELQMKKIQI